MCGIVGGIGDPRAEGVEALAHRGPDDQAIEQLGSFWLGHTRLAIQDLDDRSNQPMTRGSVTLVYNGELWNAPELRARLRAKHRARFTTAGDTEVVAWALSTWGVRALQELEGMFAIAWVDAEDDFAILRLARDRHGEVPLHMFTGRPFAFASEVKALVDALGCDPRGVEWVEPGWVIEVGPDGFSGERWYDARLRIEKRRQDEDELRDLGVQSLHSRERARSEIRRLVEHGVDERKVSDVPVCTLLSGGIDSAVVAAHLKSRIPNLVAYVATMDERSPDLRAAREVAAHLEIELREVVVPAPTADDLANVVRAIEMPHKAQVEIGWACLRLADRIRADGFKVTFSGEGSDELWASYGFSYHGIAKDGWWEHRRRLFREQHRKNFARCNKVFMSRGIECRLPFLSTGLVEAALSMSMEVVRDGTRPKSVLQDSHADLLPSRIVRRAKLAFQDGMGLKEACARAVADPEGFYRGEHRRLYG